MTATIEERFEAIEADINRIMEQLQEAATVDSAASFATITDEELQVLLNRIKRLEDRILALRYKRQVAAKKDS